MGLDLSLTCSGLALIDGPLLEDTWTETSKGKRGDTWRQRSNRLDDLGNRIIRWVVESEPDLVVVEAPSYGSQGGSTHDRSGLWWAVVQALYELVPQVGLVAPTARAKYGTGNGRAQKKEVHDTVKQTYGHAADLAIKTNDEADAVLLAAMGARHLGQPIEPFEVPKSHLDAMDKVAWT